MHEPTNPKLHENVQAHLCRTNQEVYICLLSAEENGKYNFMITDDWYNYNYNPTYGVGHNKSATRPVRLNYSSSLYMAYILECYHIIH